MKIKKSHKIFFRFFVIFAALYLLFLLTKVAFRYGLYYFVNKQSKGIYTLKFGKSVVNPFTQSYLLTDFELIPDTTKIFSDTSIKQNFYLIKLDTLSVRNLALIKLFARNNQLKINKLALSNLTLTLINSKGKQPDSTNYKTFYKDALNSFFTYVKKIRINNLELKHAKIKYLKTAGILPETFQADDINVIFTDLNIDKQTFVNFRKVFYDDLIIKIYDYKVLLSDKFHLFKAKELVLNSKKEQIYLKDFILCPLREDLIKKTNLPLFDVKVESVALSGADTKSFFSGKNLLIRKAFFKNPSIKIFRLPQKNVKNNKIDIRKIDVYQLFKEYLNKIQIDTIVVQNGSYAGYKTLSEKSLQMSIDSMFLSLYDVLADSNSTNDTSRVILAKDFEMKIGNFEMKLADSIHFVISDRMFLSTLEKKIVAENFYILPQKWKTAFAKANFKSLNKIRIPYLKITGIDLKKLFHNKILKIKMLRTVNPDITITNFADTLKKKKSSSLKQLTKNILIYAQVDNIVIRGGKFRYKLITPVKELQTSGKLQMFLSNFSFKPNSKKITKFFYANRVDLTFTDYVLYSSNSLQKIQADTFVINTQKRQIRLKNFKILPARQKLDSLLIANKKSLVINLSVPGVSAFDVDINKFFIENKLFVREIAVTNPVLNFNYYPEYSVPKKKREIIRRQRLLLTNKIIDAHTSTNIDIYLKFSNFDSSRYNIYRQKIALTDSLLIAAKNFLAKIPTKVLIEDSTILKKITDTTIWAFAVVRDSSVKAAQKYARGVKKYITSLLNKKTAQTISSKEILDLLASFVDVVKVDSMHLDSANLLINNKLPNKLKNIFQNNFDIVLYKFYFNKDSLDSLSKRLFLSDNLLFTVRNVKFLLPDNLHQLNVKKIIYSEADSSLVLELVNISPVFSKRNAFKTKIYAYIPKIKLLGLKLKNLQNNYLKISKLIFEQPGILLSLTNRHTQKRTRQSEIFLPSKIRKIQIDTIVFDDANFTVKRDTQSFVNASSFTLLTTNFFADSTFLPQNLLFFLPVQTLKTTVPKLTVNLKNGSQLIFDTLKYDSRSGNLSFYKIFALLKKDTVYDSVIVSKSTLYGLKTSDLRFNRKLNFDSLITKKTTLILTSKKQTANEKKKISEINYYDKVKKIFKSINFAKLIADTIKLILKSENNVRKINNLGLIVESFSLNEKSKFYSPNIFFSKNITLIYRDFSKLSKDSLYEQGFKQFRLTTAKNSITLDSLYISPAMSYEEIQKHKKYRTTANKILIRTVIVQDIDLQKLIDSGKIDINAITLNSGSMDFYVDMRVPHDTIRKKHFVEYFLDFKTPLNINVINFRNFYVKYTEISKLTSEPSYVFMKDFSGKILNVTNNQKLITDKDLYTIVNMSGSLQGAADFNAKLSISLKKRGNMSSLVGSLGECDARIFNTYTVNGFRIEIISGKLIKTFFKLRTYDTIAIGRMLMQYNNLKMKVLRNDSLRQEKKFLSWLINSFLRNNSNRLGLLSRSAPIGYIHDPAYSDIKMWIRAILSGVQSNIAYQSRDIKRIKRKYLIKLNLTDF